MIPRTSLDLATAIPAEHNGWTPKGDDLSEEGFAYFRGTWLIRGVGVREAKEVIANELVLLELAERLADNPEEFDVVAGALEDDESEALPEQLTQRVAFKEIQPHLGSDPQLGGLELGVAGLVYALSAVGCWPAASCRGHPNEHAWADHPVVYKACDSHRVSVLQPMVEAAGCGFGIDPSRPDLLFVEAKSIREMMSLAQLVVVVRKTFILRRAPRRPSEHGSVSQGRFDFGPGDPIGQSRDSQQSAQ